MNALYQRLKELDPDTFQRLCFHILKERHPGLEIRHVEGASGDQGLDIFAGELYGRPSIWQCKSFSGRIGKSQKEQIKDSLKTALKHSSPSCWVLCLSVGMDAKTLRWFERLKKSYESQVKIGLLTNEGIVHEVMHRRTICNLFFPGAVIDSTELKSLITGTGEMTLEQLENVTDANLEQIIERRKDRDARFNYQIVFDGDLGPRKGPVPDGLVLSISSGAKTLNVFARDVAALNSNPPTLSVQVKGTGVEKFMSLVETGAPQEFTANELGTITSDWDLLSPVTRGDGGYTMFVGPSPAVTNTKKSVRVAFRRTDNAETVDYSLLELRLARAGNKEAEFSLSGKHVPFTMLLVVSVPPQGTVQISVHYSGIGKRVREMKKMLDAVSIMHNPSELVITDLETDRVFMRMNSELFAETPKELGYRRMVNQLVAVADRFGADLVVPDKITDEDYKTISLLKKYMNNLAEQMENISVEIVKTDENKDVVPDLLGAGKGVFRFTHPRISPLPKLFGTEIDTGPVMEEFEGEVRDLAATIKSFEETKVGSAVKISFRPGPMRFSLLPKADMNESAFKPVGDLAPATDK